MNRTTPSKQAGAQLKQAVQDACSIALARAYPEWNIRQSGTGRWYATVRRRPGHGQVQTWRNFAAEADNLDDLATQIAEHDLPAGRTETGAGRRPTYPQAGRADGEDADTTVCAAIQERRA